MCIDGGKVQSTIELLLVLVVFYEGVIAKGGREEFPIDWDYTIVVKVNSPMSLQGS